MRSVTMSFTHFNGGPADYRILQLGKDDSNADRLLKIRSVFSQLVQQNQALAEEMMHFKSRTRPQLGRNGAVLSSPPTFSTPFAAALGDSFPSPPKFHSLLTASDSDISEPTSMRVTPANHQVIAEDCTNDVSSLQAELEAERRLRKEAEVLKEKLQESLRSTLPKISSNDFASQLVLTSPLTASNVESDSDHPSLLRPLVPVRPLPDSKTTASPHSFPCDDAFDAETLSDRVDISERLANSRTVGQPRLAGNQQSLLNAWHTVHGTSAASPDGNAKLQLQLERELESARLEASKRGALVDQLAATVDLLSAQLRKATGESEQLRGELQRTKAQVRMLESTLQQVQQAAQLEAQSGTAPQPNPTETDTTLNEYFNNTSSTPGKLEHEVAGFRAENQRLLASLKHPSRQISNEHGLAQKVETAWVGIAATPGFTLSDATSVMAAVSYKHSLPSLPAVQGQCTMPLTAHDRGSATMRAAGKLPEKHIAQGVSAEWSATNSASASKHERAVMAQVTESSRSRQTLPLCIANHKRLINALTGVFLAGPANAEKLAMYRNVLNSNAGKHMVMLLVASGSRSSRHLAGLYRVIDTAEEARALAELQRDRIPADHILAIKAAGTGPSILTSSTVHATLKFDSTLRDFKEIGPGKSIPITADAACIDSADMPSSSAQKHSSH